MTESQASFIYEALATAGHDTYVTSYSGRGMYGEETPAVVTYCDIGEVISILMVASAEAAEEEKDFIFSMPRFNIDNMGRGIVIY
jgi:hypothetical protein